MRTKEQVATEIVDAILKDLGDRHGLRDEWDAISIDIRDEIRKTWIEIVVRIV